MKSNFSKTLSLGGATPSSSSDIHKNHSFVPDCGNSQKKLTSGIKYKVLRNQMKWITMLFRFVWSPACIRQHRVNAILKAHIETLRWIPATSCNRSCLKQPFCVWLCAHVHWQKTRNKVWKLTPSHTRSAPWIVSVASHFLYLRSKESSSQLFHVCVSRCIFHQRLTLDCVISSFSLSHFYPHEFPAFVFPSLYCLWKSWCISIRLWSIKISPVQNWVWHVALTEHFGVDMIYCCMYKKGRNTDLLSKYKFNSTGNKQKISKQIC